MQSRLISILLLADERMERTASLAGGPIVGVGLKLRELTVRREKVLPELLAIRHVVGAVVLALASVVAKVPHRRFVVHRALVTVEVRRVLGPAHLNRPIVQLRYLLLGVLLVDHILIWGDFCFA